MEKVIFSKEYLSTLSLEQIRHLDIRTVEDERIVQEVVNEKEAAEYSPADIDISGIERAVLTDTIKNPEDEAKVQNRIDKMVEKGRSQYEKEVPEAVEEEVAV